MNQFFPPPDPQAIVVWQDPVQTEWYYDCFDGLYLGLEEALTYATGEVYKANINQPYLSKVITVSVSTWNPHFYNQNAKCSCGHSYHRHFDSYEDMAPVGCKYCSCSHWTKPVGELET